jgi:hypothetical protein
MNELVGGVRDSGDRKAYEPPRLEVYGDLSRLTTTVGMVLLNDGGNMGADLKTT